MTVPTRMWIEMPGQDALACRRLASSAADIARRNAPKMSGRSARRIRPISGVGWYGLAWSDAYVWYQEEGINPFTMRSLAGKTIPMWIDDPTGAERAKNPRARTRTTASGKTQVLIFRRAAKIGARRRVRRRGAMVDAPASYPGAPGRIAVREAAAPLTTPGRVGGRIAVRNVGVRWRHPGLAPRGFLANGLLQAAQQASLPLDRAVILTGQG